MSTQAQPIWDDPYAIDPARRYQQPHTPQNPSSYNSSPSVPFGTSPTYVNRLQIQPSSFVGPDGNLVLETSSSNFGTSSHSTHISPDYSQGRLDPNHVNGYQASPFGPSVEIGHTPEGSPNPNVAVANHSTPHSYLPAGPMQFSTPLPLPPRQSEIQSRIFTSFPQTPQVTLPRLKRHKQVDGYDSQGEQPDNAEHEAPRAKHSGACARCKSLKVRCEFISDSDTCKRCTGAGQECVIPGRKPRRVPPKREHLLNQIREQAKQIQELMAKVELLSHPSAAQSPRSPTSSLHSPLESNSESVVPNAEMQNWIAKARVSLEEFGGLIPAGDPTDGDDHLSDDGAAVEDYDYSDDESGYATAEDDTSRDLGSPGGSSIRKPAAHPASLKLLPAEDAPYGLMAALAIRRNARERSAEPELSEALGVANTDFFRPSPGPDVKRFLPSTTGVQLPPILARGIVTTTEVDQLFSIYFEKMNISISLLDPVLHTAQYVAVRSPFLFTMICAVASRVYEPRPELYQQLIQYGQVAAGNALISGTKNEEMSAAYLLMQLYPVPSKRWDEERSWIYLGVAIRVAQDINLNRPVTTKPLNEHHARVLLSRQRIWLNCFNLDRSTGTQYGKRPIISNTDYLAVHSEDWWKSSPYNAKGFDIHLCGYNAELRFISGFMSQIYGDPNHPIGLNKRLNIAELASETDDSLRKLWEHWSKRLDEFEAEKTEVWEFRTELLRMVFAYARLVALSTGLKHVKESQMDEKTLIMRCLDAATHVVNAFVRRLFPTPERKSFLRHAPDAQFVFVTFAGAFLVKLLQPKYSQYFTFENRQGIRALVQEAVDLLGSPEVVVDDKHGPKLFSRFLSSLLATQPVSQDTLSPTRATHLRRDSSRSKFPGKGRESSGSLTSSPFPPSASSSEFSSPVVTAESPSALQHLPPLEGNARGHSPSTEFGLGLNAVDFYQGTPMPVDQELLDSMQFMTDPVWQDTMMPGFNWLNQLNVSGSALNTNDYAMYDQLQYATY